MNKQHLLAALLSISLLHSSNQMQKWRKEVEAITNKLIEIDKDANKWANQEKTDQGKFLIIEITKQANSYFQLDARRQNLIEMIERIEGIEEKAKQEIS